VPGTDLGKYKGALFARFGNAAIADALKRITESSSDRISIFLLPVIRDQLAKGGAVERAAAVIAGWCRYAEGKDEQGGETMLEKERYADELTELARKERSNRWRS
jgi:mannitol 2-dehydrogenase